MKKRCPIKTALNKQYLPHEKFQSLSFNLSYDRYDKQIYTHYSRSSIYWAISDGLLKFDTTIDNVDLIAQLVLDELFEIIYSEELIAEYKALLKNNTLDFKEFLVVMKEVYNKSGIEFFEKYRKVGMKRMKDMILEVIYLVLKVHCPAYLKVYSSDYKGVQPC